MRAALHIIALTLCLLFGPAAAEAQTGKVPRVGFLCWVTCGDDDHEAFWRALRKLGYTDYKNIAFVNRVSGGHGALLNTLALELARLEPAVIVADTTQSAQALKNATSTIPLVVIADDPVGSGLVSNLARPEGNITGLSTVAADLGVKQLQILREAIPKASRVAVVGNPINPATELRLRAIQAAGRTLGVTVLPLEARAPGEYERVFAKMPEMHIDAVVDLLGAADRSNSATTGRVLQLAMNNGLPVIYQSEDLVVEGGLMSYAANLGDEFMRAASYVNKILKGAKPADLPVEEPAKFKLVVNLKTAHALGLEIPTSLIVAADRLIE
jgi:ABC-type uncharacterized transport system substrate-binding protein